MATFVQITFEIFFQSCYEVIYHFVDTFLCGEFFDNFCFLKSLQTSTKMSNLSYLKRSFHSFCIKKDSIIIHIENAEKSFPCVGVLLMGWEGTCMTLKYISIQVLDIFMYLFLKRNNFYFLFSGKPKELMKINCVTWDISTWFKLGRVTKLIQVEMAFDASKLHF